ncbi:MAG: 7-carboxy-7-deazaguanine synthase QueE [Legionellales bacterium]|jgi:7-carboxy-7-deazaguanine synthase|nr:7-carboxy-7-deazaguanine synthase QueE [Legionellales bacterium]
MSASVIAKNNTEINLKINEIFYSLQGETSSTGYPTVFIRLTGCPLRCTYCDTSYAFSKGEMLSVPEILNKVKKHNTSHITVTGGEPLAQKNCLKLLTLLCDQYQDVSLETSGAMPIGKVDPRVRKIIDIKTPDSGEMHRNLISNLALIKTTDEIKFVICSHTDFIWATNFVVKHDLINITDVIFSPSHNAIEIKDLAEWVLQSNMKIRVQMQLHKIIWGDEPGK